MVNENRVFHNYLRVNGLKATRQRQVILNTFLRTEEHLSVEELYRLVQQEDPGISRPTVFRTLKLLARAGLARTLKLEEKTTLYEHEYRHSHHDHLVCEACGRITEVSDREMENQQKRLCRRMQFHPRYHRLKIFGLCRDCHAKKGKNRG